MKQTAASFSLSDEIRRASPSEADFARLQSLVDALMSRINLSRKQRNLFFDSFSDAIGWYLKNGLCAGEIERRLAPEKLGYFYFEDPEDWYRLDTAATIYPLSMSRGWMPIFRLSAYLSEEIVPEILQMALTFTIRRFPYFCVKLGRGFFWDYMDSIRFCFRIREESRRPFSVLNLSKEHAPCFRVLHYQNRVSVEYFHLLTDGTGGLVFLKNLIAEYFRLLGVDVGCGGDLFDLSAPADAREWSDDFHLAEPGEKASGFTGKRALQLKGALSGQRPHQILHFELDAEKLRTRAREKGVTATALLLTHFFFACKSSVGSGHGKIQIQVPCNMRKYYPSRTLRNFAMYCILGLHPSEICDFDSVLARVSEELASGTSKEELTRQMLASTRLVASLRFVPMFLKTPLVRWFYPLFSDHIITTTLSNLGVVELPSELAEHVEKFDFVLGTTVQNRATCSLITYRNKAVLSIFKASAHPGFEEALCRQLKQDGLTPVVTGSEAHGFHRCLSEN